ncbi:hypothetical protein R1flu_005617 [Riccia fluitans]|uniref:peptidylprolyl isomerase n=1 Tax=Riccia fluitans TaxID=41844 RepID=A0ABD1YTX5_9MARC
MTCLFKHEGDKGESGDFLLLACHKKPKTKSKKMVAAMAATMPHKLHLCPLSDMVSVVGLRVTPLASQRSLCMLRIRASAISFEAVAAFKRCCYPRCRARVTCAALDDGLSRRETLGISGAGLLGLMLSMNLISVDEALAGEYADMPALRGKDYGKSKMRFPDYVETPSGLQYKDLREGAGPVPEQGDQVMVDWAGYTIGYNGRIFEARNKAKGGSFEGNEKDFFKFRVGNNEVIPAFEEAIKTMHVGGVRRVIVPPELGYPNNDYNTKGPRPATFSGQRALDFVLKNQGLIDRTLLFDIELLKLACTYKKKQQSSVYYLTFEAEDS